MSDPTARALDLLSLLQTHRHWRGPELAERLGVSERTLRRDVDRLRNLGYPVDAVPGPDGGYRLAVGAHLPPLVMDDDEAVALAVALRTLTSSPISGIEDTSLRLLSKFEHVLPDRLRQRVEAAFANVSVVAWAGEAAEVSAAVLTTLAEGCQDRVEVGFDYEAHDATRSRRLVHPHRLVTVGRRWYLLAWDVRRTDWRTFRVDRIDSARVLGGRFEPHPIPGGDAAAFVTERLHQDVTEFVIRLRVDGVGDELDRRCRMAGARVVDRGLDHAELELTDRAADWLAVRTLSLAMSGPVAVVHASDEVAEALRRAIDGVAPGGVVRGLGQPS